MREKRKGVSLKVWIMYVIMILLTFILLGITEEKNRIENPVDRQYKDTISLMDGWVDDKGNAVDLKRLDKNKDIKVKKEFRIYHSIPYNTKEGNTLNITAKNICYQLYVDGIQLLDVYNTDDLEKCYGRRYSFIPVQKAMAGKTIEMRLRVLYDDKNSCFLDISLGLPQGYLLHFAKHKVISLVTCMLFLFVSVMLILVDIPINMKRKKNHELLALGLFAFAIGIWGLLSIHCMEPFSGNGYVIQVASCLFLTLIVLPLLVYIKESMGYFTYRELNAYATIFFVEFLAVWVLELTGKADVIKTLKYTHITLAIGVLLLISLPFRKSESREENNDSMFYKTFRALGFFALLIATVVDLIRFYRGIFLDNAIFVRFGLLLFIICFGVASLEKTIQAVKIGAKAEFISQLAYQDGLTNLSNRTAFNEQLEMLQAKPQNVAIIMFDVNDLKKVNDNLGHQYGDEMLVKSATIIFDAFGTMGGECYRIGGDEFVVIFMQDNMREAIIDALQRFNESVDKYNKEDDIKYQIRIAYGYAILEEEQCSIMQLYEIADQRMYECKKKMKEQV